MMHLCCFIHNMPFIKNLCTTITIFIVKAVQISFCSINTICGHIIFWWLCTNSFILNPCHIFRFFSQNISPISLIIHNHILSNHILRKMTLKSTLLLIFASKRIQYFSKNTPTLCCSINWRVIYCKIRVFIFKFFKTILVLHLKEIFERPEHTTVIQNFFNIQTQKIVTISFAETNIFQQFFINNRIFIPSTFPFAMNYSCCIKQLNWLTKILIILI